MNNLKGYSVDKTMPLINWTEPTDLNGPLDGYLLNLRGLTNRSLSINKILPASQTFYVYNTTEEFEK